MNKDKSKPLTLDEFRKMTAHLPGDTLIVERAHETHRVVWTDDVRIDTDVADAFSKEELRVTGRTLTEAKEELGLPRRAPIPTLVVEFSACD